MNIQEKIDRLPSGATLQFNLPEEIEGPVILSKPIVIEGMGVSFWSSQGPVLKIESEGVSLNNLNVTVTGRHDVHDGEEVCAIRIAKGVTVSFDHVVIRGTVIGLKEEEGEWQYPHSLRLGTLRAGSHHKFTLKLAVPVPCRLKSEIAGLSLQPTNLRAGIAEVSITVESLPPGTRLRGNILVLSAFLCRSISVTATMPRNATGNEIIGKGQIVYEPQIIAPALPPAPVPAKPEPERHAPDTKAGKKTKTKKPPKRTQPTPPRVPPPDIVRTPTPRRPVSIDEKPFVPKQQQPEPPAHGPSRKGQSTAIKSTVWDKDKSPASPVPKEVENSSTETNAKEPRVPPAPPPSKSSQDVTSQPKGGGGSGAFLAFQSGSIPPSKKQSEKAQQKPSDQKDTEETDSKSDSVPESPLKQDPKKTKTLHKPKRSKGSDIASFFGRDSKKS